jgi:hypothetical protein
VWQLHTAVADWHQLSLPAELAPGRYDLLISLVDGGMPAGEPVRLTTIDIEPGG